MTVNVRLVSPIATAAAPFYFAQAFRQGQYPDSVIVAGATGHQVVVKRRWLDGSVKLAHIAGRATVAASNNVLFDNVPTTLTLTPGAAVIGTNLTAASITAAAPTASVAFGGTYAAVDLTSQLASPINTWISGPEMVEATYQALVPGTGICVVFYVKLYLDGRMQVLVAVRNGYLDNGAGAIYGGPTYSYIPTITIGGAVVYTSATAVTHAAKSTYFARGWIGVNPQVTPLHDPAYLISTKLVPNYSYTPTEALLASLTQTAIPLDRGPWPLSMGGTGFQGHIGLLPKWDVCAVKVAQVRTRNASVAGSEALRSATVNFFDFTTKKPIRPSNFPNWSVGGANQGGVTGGNSGIMDWRDSHHGSAGFVAYLLTGDQHHLETMALQSAFSYLCGDINGGLGTNRFITGQERGIAWKNRTIAQYVSVAPTGDVVADDYRVLFARQMTHWASKGPRNINAGDLGYPTSTSTYSSTQPLSVAPWMFHFWIQSMGHSWDLEPGFNAVDTASHLAIRDWMYKAIVGILGGNGSANYCYSGASAYNITISAQTFGYFSVKDPDVFYKTWGEVHTATYGAPNTACGNTMGGLGASAPGASGEGYWANLMPAIAYAVEHNAPGAAVSYARITSSTDYVALRDSGFANNMVFAVTPRDIAVAVTPVSGRSTRLETAAMSAARTQIGNAGLGLLGSEMASVGTSGPGYIYPALSLPADASFEITGKITRYPVNGLLVTYEDGSFQYTGTTDYFEWQLLVAGVPSTNDALGFGPGISRVALNVGAASLVTSVTVAPSTSAGSATFTATVAGAASHSQAVTWTATAGSISAGGVFTAPAATASVQTITITATSAQDGTKTGTATVSIAASGVQATALTLSGTSGGVVGVASIAFTVGANGTVSGGMIYTPNDASGGGTFNPASGPLGTTFTYTPSSTGVKTIGITNNAGLLNPPSLTYTVSAAVATSTTFGNTNVFGVNMKKNTAGQTVGVQMTYLNGEDFNGSVIAYVTGDNGSQTSGGACVSKGNGYFVYLPTQAETNYARVSYTFKGVGAATVTATIYTSFPQTGDAPTANQVADTTLNRDMAAVGDTNTRSVLNALRFIRNKWTNSGTTLTVFKEDDVTPAWTAVLASTPGADPVSGVDPA